MNNFFKKYFFRSKNLDYIGFEFKKLYRDSDIKKIFDTINFYSEISEIRYVGGCVRKIINQEDVDDIDLATNLKPEEVINALEKENINFFKSGIDHGTVTALINEKKFEITSLRKDIFTDGRHAKVEFSLNWKEDALRRDFTINAIYADKNGNLFDPFNGKKDLINGEINFIGNAEKRIKEDYLRILRYIRFYINYSKEKHKAQTLRDIKKNLNGIAIISSERLLDEFKKLTRSNKFLKLTKDKDCIEIISLIFPQFKSFQILKNLNSYAEKNFFKFDFIFLLSLLIIDGSDNVDYFIYKFKLSKKDQTRIKFINNFFKVKINSKTFLEKNLNFIFYFNGKEALNDILNFRLFKLNKPDPNLIEMIKKFENKKVPLMPFGANVLMNKYKLPAGKQLGNKLDEIEKSWVNNNFYISEKDVEKIINN
jgi:poly(A) polymerase